MRKTAQPTAEQEDDEIEATVREALAFGVAGDDLDRVREQKRDEVESRHVQPFPVHRDNWRSLRLFLAVQTQWVAVAGMAGAFYLGIDYQCVRATLGMLNVPRARHPRLLHDLHVMELAALPVMNERDDADAAPADAN